LLRAREAGLAVWPLPPGLDDDEVLEQRLFRRMGRPPRDSDEPNWPKVASELKRKGVTLNLLWQEYREAHPDGYGYTWFCCRFADHESRAKPTYRSRHVGGVAMECDYAGHTIPIIDPSTGEIRAAQIYVAVLSASQLTFSYASFSQKLPDWIEANQRAFSYFGGVTKTTICDNLKSAVQDAIERAGAKLMFLPPYSPDFNPIENAFSKLKAMLRGRAERKIDALWDAVGALILRFTPDECAKYFRAAGYDPD
ncbi:transposase, partial [Sinorhizobium meliloti]|uniref:transposase n=1 Tax=Rhizobium meliloti TaxID=382 RepID=UPI001F394044